MNFFEPTSKWIAKSELTLLVPQNELMRPIYPKTAAQIAILRDYNKVTTSRDC